MDVKKVIQSIIDDFSVNKDISDIFLQVQVLVHLLKDDQLTQWFESEQHGYKEGILPEYRVIKVSIIGSVEQDRDSLGKILRRNMILSPSHIEDEQFIEMLTTYNVREPLNKIQKMIQQNGSIRFILPYSCIDFLQQGLSANYHIIQVWQEIERASLNNILVQVKSKLLQFLLELNDSLDLNVNINSLGDKKQIEKVMNNTIYAATVTFGDNSAINVNNSTVVGGKDNIVTISNEVKKELENIVTQIETLINETGDNQTKIEDTINSIREELSSKIPRPGFLKAAFNSLNGVGLGVVANQLTPFVNSAIELLRNTINIAL